MRYLLAVLLPPAAVLLCRSRQVPTNVLLTACLWLPGAIHALRVVRDTTVRERADRVADVVLASEERLLRARRAISARLVRSRA
jgi:uncharacterized membrane protein YqaE (UPF0057 family)